MKASPKQQLLKLAGVTESDSSWSGQVSDIKKKLVSEIAPLLDKAEGESNDDLVARLTGQYGNGGISNKKLVKLYKMVQRLKSDFGDKDGLVKKLLEARKGESGNYDAGYEAHLNKKTIATLLLHFDHAKKAGLL